MALTCCHGSESFYFVFSDPASIIRVRRQSLELLFDHIAIYHQADILGNLRDKVCQIRSICRTAGQYEAVRAEILHVILYPVKPTGVAECLDETKGLGRGAPVHLKETMSPF